MGGERNQPKCRGFFRNPDHLPVVAFVAPINRDGTIYGRSGTKDSPHHLDDFPEGVKYRHTNHIAGCTCPEERATST